jgi:hypothetical protein
VPSHVRIEGNEVVDKLAKNAPTNLMSEESNIMVQNDLKPYLKQKIIQKWQQTWNNTPLRLYEVNKHPYLWKPKVKDRREHVMLTRVVSGVINKRMKSR